MANRITTEIVSINSSGGSDTNNIDLDDTVVIKNVIDGKERIERDVKVEWIFGQTSNYFLDNSASDARRVGLLMRKAVEQNMPSMVSKDVWDYIHKSKK